MSVRIGPIWIDPLAPGILKNPRLRIRPIRLGLNSIRSILWAGVGMCVTEESRKTAAGSLVPDKVLRLTRAEVDDARKLLAKLSEEFPGSAVSQSPADLLEQAKETYSNRRRRAHYFGEAMFSEPAWDMLLLLYILRDGGRLSVSALARETGFSKTTALRWLGYLDSHKLIDRDEHPTDKRVAFVTISLKGKDLLEAYLSETLVLKT